MLVITDHPDYRDLDVAELLTGSRVRLVYDSWRILDAARITGRGVQYASLGYEPAGPRQPLAEVSVMKTLILGGAGFIGVHLARRLQAAGHQVTIVDDFSRGRGDPELAALGVPVRHADLTDPASYAGLPRGWDQVYMLAAVVGVRNVEKDPARVVRVNTLALMNLLDWLEPGQRLFFASTSEVYAGGVSHGLVPVPTPGDRPGHGRGRHGAAVRLRDQQAAGRGRGDPHGRARGHPVCHRPVP